MESSDGTLREPAASNTEPASASPSAKLAALSAASPLCLAPHDLPSSEALDDCPQIHPPSSHSDASSDRLLQVPSSEFSCRDLSSSFSQQQQGDISLITPAKASADISLRPQSSSHELSSRSVDSSELPMNDSLTNDHNDEKAHHPSHNASTTKQVLPSEFCGPTRNPSVEEGCSSSAADSQAEELWPCTSANENANGNLLEQPPVVRSAQELSDVSREEESNCTPEEQELSDDVKQEILKEKYTDVAILSCNSEAMGSPSYVYLIGTAHVSEESCREVQAVISLMKPEVVFVELCQKRAFILRRRPIAVPTLSDMLASWKESRTNMLGILYSWYVGKVAAELHILPGSEFRAAYEEAQVWGAKVILGDRDIEVTLRRTWGKMSTWHKTKFIALLVFNAFCLPKADQLNELIEKLKDNDMITVAFEELGKTFPTLLETLIDERDMFMAAVLRKLGEDNSSIVAVVGRGHIAGIRKQWGQAICIQNLLEIPPKRSMWTTPFKLFLLSVLIGLLSIIFYVYYR